MQVSWSVCITFLFAINFKDSHEARILAVFPCQSKSHITVDKAVVKELAKRGHDVTVVSAFPEQNPLPNYRDIVLKTYTEEDFVNLTGRHFDPFDMIEVNIYQIVLMLWYFGGLACDKVLAEEPIQKLIKSHQQFDLIFLESFYIDCFLGFAHTFKAPVIQISTFSGTEEFGDLVGNPSPYAHIPDPYQQFSNKMNFKERVFNTLGYLFQKLARRYFIREQDGYMRKHFNDPNMPSVEELAKSTALVLINQHFSISYPRPAVPNYIEVGGMHIQPPKKLPTDLQKYLDEAKDGVIYFSMGSNLKSCQMPKTTVDAFTRAFSKLKQKVIWKWENDSLPGQPPNLKLGKWLPQSDILVHPSVKLFITHGGLLSIQETIARGVPVVGIPIYGDQSLNMAKIESMEFGKTLEFKNISEESIIWTVKEVIENPKYRQNAQRISRIYRDQPLTPLETAAFWSEYVIRHKGAPHMRSAALDLTWYQYFLLDVIVVLTLAICAVLFFLFMIFRAAFRWCCSVSPPKTKISSRKKIN